MLVTSKNVLFPGHNHLLTTGAGNHWMTLHFDYRLSASEHDSKCEGSSSPVVSRWLGPGNRTFLEVDSMVVTWWIVAFFAQ